jgi:hypothetical protein
MEMMDENAPGSTEGAKRPEQPRDGGRSRRASYAARTKTAQEVDAVAQGIVPARSDGMLGSRAAPQRVDVATLLLPLPPKLRVCGFWVRGNCRHADTCRNLHARASTTEATQQIGGQQRDTTMERSEQPRESRQADDQAAHQAATLPIAQLADGHDEPPRKHPRVPQGPTVWRISVPRGFWKPVICAACSGVIPPQVP